MKKRLIIIIFILLLLIYPIWYGANWYAAGLADQTKLIEYNMVDDFFYCQKWRPELFNKNAKITYLGTITAPKYQIMFYTEKQMSVYAWVVKHSYTDLFPYFGHKAFLNKKTAVQNNIKINVKLQNKTVTGDPLLLTIEMINIGPNDVYYSISTLRSYGGCKIKIFNTNGDPVRSIVLRPYLGSGSILPLKPNQKVEKVFDLAKDFDLNKSGRYKITIGQSFFSSIFFHPDPGNKVYYIIIDDLEFEIIE